MARLRLEKKTLNIYKSIWHQHVGPVKTAASEKVMPLDDEMISDLQLWRMETPYADQDDWVFASFRKKGRQPLWPEALMRTFDQQQHVPGSTNILAGTYFGIASRIC